MFVFRGTPLLVQIFLIYYGLGQFRPALQEFGLWTFLREPYWCALAALTLNTAAYASEIIRGGLLAVPHEQIEAARACGMSGLLLFRRIVCPDRASAGAAGLRQRDHPDGQGDLARLHHHPDGGHRHRPQADLARPSARSRSSSAPGAIYLVLNFVVTRVVQALECRLSPHLRQRPLPRRRV